MFSSKLTYSVQLILFIAFNFISNAVFASHVDFEDQLILQSNAHSAAFSNPIHHSSSHLFALLEIESNQIEEVHEEVQEDYAKKAVKNDFKISHYSYCIPSNKPNQFFAFRQTNSGTTYSAFHFILEHKLALNTLFCVFLC